jgi:hypothetical protein
LALASDLKGAFEAAGFMVRSLAEYPPSLQLAGVAIYSNQQHNLSLAPAISQIFEEIAQEPMDWVDQDIDGTGNATLPKPDLKIIVGKR